MSKKRKLLQDIGELFGHHLTGDPVVTIADVNNNGQYGEKDIMAWAKSEVSADLIKRHNAYPRLIDLLKKSINGTIEREVVTNKIKRILEELGEMK